MANVLFIQDLGYEHLGTMYLAAMLKRHGHDCNVVINNLERAPLKCVKEHNPDLVGFSVVTGTQDWALDMAKRIKMVVPTCKIIFGGPHPTHFPEIIRQEQVDFVCRGEGEHALLELAQALDDKRDTTAIQNIWSKRGALVVENDVRNLVEDLDSLPFPDRSLYDRYPTISRRPQKRFLTTRGCPYACSFCFEPALKKMYQNKGKYVRRRSVAGAIEEIREVHKTFPFKTVFFDDDTFILDLAWVLDFLREYREKIKLPFICLVRANLLTEPLVQELKASGCKRIFFGVETGNEALRNALLKKHLSNAQIIQAAELLHKHKIRFKTYNMLGLPDETLDTAFETLELNARIKTDYPWCSIFQPYPGTELGHYAVERGYMDAEFDESDIPAYYSKSILTQKKDIRQIMNLQRLFIAGIKFPRLMPLIKRLVTLPPNFIFDLVFFAGFFYTYVGSQDNGLLNSFRDGLHSARLFFLKKFKK